MSHVQTFAEVNGAHFCYEIAGSGTPVVLIHGLGSNLRFWNNHFESFAKRHIVIRYDLRGHGKSTLPSGETYSHSEDLDVLLDHLNISRAHLVGQSLGGEIAIDFALSYPEKVMSLVLTDSSLNGHQWSTAWGESWLPIIEAAPSGREAWLPLVLAHPMFGPGLRQSSVRAGLTELFSSYTAWHFMNADPVVKSDPPASQRLEDIQVPSLVLVGELEPPDFLAISKLLGEKIPNVQKIEFGNTGHVLPMEAPEKFNEVVLNFLEGK